MKEQDIKVGDRLRIRQWGDMEHEFGLDSDGNISCDASFTGTMRDDFHLCGQPFTVTSMSKSEQGFMKYESQEGCFFIITADMLEPIEEPVEITPFTDDEMRLLLGI